MIKNALIIGFSGQEFVQKYQNFFSDVVGKIYEL
jgi:hypothetical protein